MKNKGFTLIELLAIIVILAIVAVITIPQIANVIEDSRKNSTKDSAYGYKNAVHQYYLTNSTNDDEFDLNGDYDIINGTLSDGLNSFNILLNGDVPKSGSVTIEDGEIVDGCIDYGNYSVVVENGNVTDAVSGGCYNISYFTYDDASLGENGYITSKLSSPNSNWPYYVKEYNFSNINSYYSFSISSHELYYGIDYPVNTSLEHCNQYFALYPSDIYECGTGNKKVYEICGVYDETTFCLRPGKSNYNYNIRILEDVFNNCTTDLEYYDFYCEGDDYDVTVSRDQDVVYIGNSSGYCFAAKNENSNGIALCLNHSVSGGENPNYKK